MYLPTKSRIQRVNSMSDLVLLGNNYIGGP